MRGRRIIIRANIFRGDIYNTVFVFTLRHGIPVVLFENDDWPGYFERRGVGRVRRLLGFLNLNSFCRTKYNIVLCN